MKRTLFVGFALALSLQVLPGCESVKQSLGVIFPTQGQAEQIMAEPSLVWRAAKIGYDAALTGFTTWALERSTSPGGLTEDEAKAVREAQKIERGARQLLDMGDLALGDGDSPALKTAVAGLSGATVRLDDLTPAPSPENATGADSGSNGGL